LLERGDSLVGIGGGFGEIETWLHDLSPMKERKGQNTSIWRLFLGFG
jgi:hypothetical protein